MIPTFPPFFNHSIRLSRLSSANFSLARFASAFEWEK